jgi:hypothetical protein
MSLNVLLISAEILKDRTAVHTNIDEKLMFPTIKVCQDMFIHPLLGSTLFNKIITDVDAATITGDYKTLLDDYIIDAICWYVLSELIFDTTYQIWNKGMVKKSGDNTDVPGSDELEGMRNRFRSRAEWYGQRLKQYLMANSTASFIPEYYNGNTELDDLNPEQRAFTMPIYLGDDYECLHLDKNNCRCNENKA